MYDIIIIGAGPAGLSAGIYAKRANKNVLIIEKSYIGGQVATLNKIENYPGFNMIDGFDLANNFKKQALALGVEFAMQEVKEVDLTSDVKVVSTYNQNYTSKAVIIATGAYAKPLAVENEKQYLGKGLSYCATCDGNFFKNKNVALVASNSAGADITYLANLAKNLYLIFDYDAPELNLDSFNSNIKIYENASVVNILGQDILTGLNIKDKKTNKITNIDIDGLFVNLGKKPHTQIFKGLKLNDGGYIVTDQNMRTNIKNVYAIGDVRNTPLKQIVTACSDGAIAVSTFIADN